MNFTYNNYLKYFINDKLWGQRTSPYDKFKVQLGPVNYETYKSSNYTNELQKTAKYVLQDLGKDLILLLSGGQDSEIIAHNFVSIGFRPRCVTCLLPGGLNLLDVANATNISKELDLPHDIIPFDIFDFYKSGEALEFGSEIQCSQTTYLMCYKVIKQLQCPAVMGGEVLLTRNVTPESSYWYYTLRENEDCSAIRFSNKYKIPLVYEWFSYTPELLLYYLTDPDIVSLVTNKYNYKLTSVSSKNKILSKLYPKVPERKKTRNGYEKMPGFNLESYRTIAQQFEKKLESSLDGLPYFEAVSSLKGNSWK